MKKAAVIAGTSEAAELILMISEEFDVMAFTATEYGREVLKNIPCKVKTGRLDKHGFERELKYFDVVADASHPFAEKVTETVKEVCRELNIPYVRMGRRKISYDYEKIVYADSKEKAAEILSETKGRILFTTGANTLMFYEENVKNFGERSWVRVLDTEDSHKITEKSSAKIIYAVPPFSKEDTSELIKRYNISVVVSKDSGERGGVPQKIAAAKENNISVVLISSPESEYLSLDKTVSFIKNCCC